MAEGKFQHVLVVVDAATRFVWLEPVESCSGRETKEKLEKIFRVVGWPGTLVSDGGSAFVNEEIERMLVGEGVERQVATPGAHEHNAPVERWIREVRAVMNKKLELKRDGWASELVRIQEALNNRYVVPLKSTPFDLFFARNPDMRKKSRGEAEGDEERVDGESNAGKLRRRNEVVVEEVYLKIAEGAKRVRQEGCDRKSKKRRRAKKFGVGELVMVRVDRKSKQDPFYEGVFEVYGDDHWKWHVSGGPVLGANETREFIIRSLGATRKGGVEAGTTQEWHLLQGATRRVELRRVIELALMTFL